MAVGIDLIKKSGAWYAYEGNKIGQGRENAKIYLESNPEIMDTIEEKVRAHYKLGENASESSPAEDLKLKSKSKSTVKEADTDENETDE